MPPKGKHSTLVKRLKPVTLKDLSRSQRTTLQKICRAHGTSIEKIPAWLLKKRPERVEYWFKTGK